MKASWETLEKNWRQFTIEVESEQFSQAIDQAYRKLVKTAKIRGFRPGKAPRPIFERFYGKETLINEALERLIPQAYGEAVKEADIEPIDRPEVDVEQAEEGSPLVFKGKVQVKPAVTLGALEGFDIPHPQAEVKADQVDEHINALRERTAQLVPDEGGTVQEGSFAVIDFEGFIDGEPLEGGKGEGHTLEIGSNRFIPGFEEQLIGAPVGETRDIKVTFPEDYHAEQLRGKEASFNVTVKDLKKKEYPELNDDFAKQVSDRFQTLQELRDDITNKLKDAAERQAERDWRNAILEAVANAAEVELPEVLVHRRIHTLIEDFAQTLQYQGLNVETYMRVTGKDAETLHKEFGEPAQKQVKLDLVMEAVAKQQGFAVDEAEIDAQFDVMAQQMGGGSALAEMQRSPEYREHVRESLLKQKAIDHVLALNRPPADGADAGQDGGAGGASDMQATTE